MGAEREKTTSISWTSRGRLVLTADELRYEVRGVQKLIGEQWKAPVREVVSIDVVDRVPLSPMSRRRRLRVKLSGGDEELFFVDDPVGQAAASLKSAMRPYRDLH